MLKRLEPDICLFHFLAALSSAQDSSTKSGSLQMTGGKGKEVADASYGVFLCNPPRRTALQKAMANDSGNKTLQTSSLKYSQDQNDLPVWYSKLFTAEDRANDLKDSENTLKESEELREQWKLIGKTKFTEEEQIENRKHLMPMTIASLMIIKEQARLERLPKQNSLKDSSGGSGKANDNDISSDEERLSEIWKRVVDKSSANAIKFIEQNRLDRFRKQISSGNSAGEVQLDATANYKDISSNDEEYDENEQESSDLPEVILQKRKVGRPKGSTKNIPFLSLAVPAEIEEEMINEGGSKKRETRQSALHRKLLEEHRLEQIVKAEKDLKKQAVAGRKKQAVGGRKKQAVGGRSVDLKSAKFSVINSESNPLMISSEEEDDSIPKKTINLMSISDKQLAMMFRPLKLEHSSLAYFAWVKLINRRMTNVIRDMMKNEMYQSSVHLLLFLVPGTCIPCGAENVLPVPVPADWDETFAIFVDGAKLPQNLLEVGGIFRYQSAFSTESEELEHTIEGLRIFMVLVQINYYDQIYDCALESNGEDDVADLYFLPNNIRSAMGHLQLNVSYDSLEETEIGNYFRFVCVFENTTMQQLFDAVSLAEGWTMPEFNMNIADTEIGADVTVLETSEMVEDEPWRLHINWPKLNIKIGHVVVSEIGEGN